MSSWLFCCLCFLFLFVFRFFLFFFFFQAEDGIRDLTVTGVQTCALPILISQADFCHLVRQVEPIVARMRPTPTFFDVLTAMAFKWFAEQKVELAVVETGLGGRLDSTNVLKPEVSAITSISKDHMAQLGSTVGKIAEEKAGIFKTGVPAVTVQQDPEVEVVLKRVAESVGTPLDIAGKSIEFSYRFESSRLQGPHNRICLSTPNSKFEDRKSVV